jgi:hypothetical protein
VLTNAFLLYLLCVNHCSGAGKDAVQSVLAPVVSGLVDTFISRLSYPPDFNSLTHDRQDFFRHEFRCVLRCGALRAGACGAQLAGWREAASASFQH